MKTSPRPSDSLYQYVGERVRRARELVGHSQHGLAEVVRLSRTSITNIEKGRQRMMLHTLVEIAEALSVTAAELLPAALSLESQEGGEHKSGLGEHDRGLIEQAIREGGRS